MARLKVAATRSNLVTIKQRLKLARDGHRVLNKKRDVLIMEILQMIGGAERIQVQVEEQFKRAYVTLQEARAAMGTERVRRIALSRPYALDIRITPHSIMGVVVPSVSFPVPPRQLFYSFGDTSVVLDQAQEEWAAILGLMGQLAETVTTVWRLALELRRTQRRVNALENVFIPSYEETLSYIQETLEEKDREELFRLKRSKARLGERGEPA
jgi:V/A-type H+-transporting ATPase subunit D